MSICQDPKGVEFAYTDEVIYECESKISTSEHLDQREKQIELKLKDPDEPDKVDGGGGVDLSSIQPHEAAASLRANVRFCYSRLKFL